MRLSRIKTTIIGALGLIALALLGGCSSVRLAYSTGPTLAWWWLDGYVDFSRDQVPVAKASIDRLFAWHRATQLPEYIGVLVQAGAQITEPTTPAQVCRWNDLVFEKLDPAIDRALSHGADLLPGLGEAQFRHIEQHYAKNLDQMREDFLQPDAAERRQASVKRARERAEQVYGRLGEAQRRLIAEGVAASPFDAQAWFDERRQRQSDNVQTLRRLAATKADRDQRVAALRALYERTQISPDPAYRSYQKKLADFNCAFAARIHNSTTPAQRLQARELLKGWEDDLRSLTESSISPAAATPG
jgi:hypothetical protein